MFKNHIYTHGKKYKTTHKNEDSLQIFNNENQIYERLGIRQSNLKYEEISIHYFNVY